MNLLFFFKPGLYVSKQTVIHGNITTDANGEANINFYTADNVTNYTIIITGLTEKGDLVYKRMTIGNTGKSR